MYSVNEFAFVVDVHRIKGLYSISDHSCRLAGSHKFVVLRGGALASKAKVAEDILRVTSVSSARNLCKFNARFAAHK
jgi:hypothetical protein